jgi:hypothetical protein
MNIRPLITGLIKPIAVTALMAMSGQANATLLSFANGGFEGYTGNHNTHNSAVPPGWTTTGGTPDTFNGDTNFAQYTWAPSSTGGDFLHGIGLQPSWTESAQQLALDGLVIGETYEISFEQSISRSQWSQTGGYWRIMFGDETYDSEMMEIPDYGVFEGWTWQTMLFTATATTQSLTVSAMSDTDGLRADLGIDSFYLGEPDQNPDKPPSDEEPPTPRVPEPGTLLLMGLGLIGVGASRRRRGQK